MITRLIIVRIVFHEIWIFNADSDTDWRSMILE